MSTQPIDFSVIIPTYNRPQQLTACLRALVQQTYPKERFEVIVVNDGGTPLTPVIEPFRERLGIALIEQANAGPAQARNRGATVARGNILAFTDDDCCPRADWLRQLAGQHEKIPHALLGGQSINALSQNLYSAASQLIVDVAYQYFNPDPTRAQFFASNNMAFPRLDFLQLGGFHPNFRTSEDREICDRWLRSQRTMAYVDSAQIDHAHPLTLSRFWRQHLSYGRGAFYYHRIRMQRGEAPFRPDFSFHRLLLVVPFKRFPVHQAIAIVVLMSLSQAASLVGYLQAQSSPPLSPEAMSNAPLPLSGAVEVEQCGNGTSVGQRFWPN
ncbi:MAG: glycosyltransferase [Elainellaceae cyanobacterium]